MNNYELYVNVSEFQKKVLEFVNSGELDKYFENTVFNNHEYKNDCKFAMITGMSLASILTSDCELYVKYNYPDQWEELVKRCNGSGQNE